MDKKNYQEEMCGFKCSILIYIYLFNYKNFFWNLHFDRADNTFTCVWERDLFQDPGIQFSLGSNDGNFSIINIGPQLSSNSRSIISPISIANIDWQHCELGPIIGPIIFSYMG